MCSQIYQELNGPNTFLPFKKFISTLEQNLKGLLEEEKSLCKNTSLKDISRESRDFIECVVWHSLEKDVAVKGLDFICNLHGHGFQDFSIFTLNHDLLIERYLNQNSIRFIDGFGELNKEIHWYKPSTYEQNIKAIRIYKLHGSINWHLLRLSSGRDQYAILSENASVDRPRDSNGILYFNPLGRPKFLSGINKGILYTTGIYADMHYYFHKILKTNHTIIMSGYGWRDKGINLKLKDWLNDNEKNKIFMFYENVEDIEPYMKFYSINHNQLVFMGKWLKDAIVNDVSAFI